MESIKLFILTTLFFLSSIISFAQKKIEQNKVNNVGSKIGFWSEMHNGQKTECYYKNGKLEGVIKTYYKNGELFYLGFYKNDTLTGNAYWFNEDGQIIVLEENISVNNFYVMNANNNKIKPLYKSNYKTYFENGSIESEGILLYEDSPLFESIECGKWIYYYEYGGVKSIVDYKDRVLIDR